MKEKMLMVATVSSMIGQFNMSNIKILQEMGYEVHVACNWEYRKAELAGEIEKLQKTLSELNVQMMQVDFSRSPWDINKLVTSYRQLHEICAGTTYKFVHCHTPVAGVISRLVCKKEKIKCIYTAHGFHFYKGAPIKNWLLYYPVEKWLSRYTDVLITINKEDYKRAKKKFHASKVVYIPGVGLDTKKFKECRVDRKKKLAELGVHEDGFVLLSVGELSKRKNQSIVIEALKELQNPNIYYLLVGQGDLYKEYQMKIKEYGLENQIILLGYRTDIKELCHVANCFIHVSLREGLGIAPLEAMASGLPLISSNINGIKDYTEDAITGYCINPHSVNETKEAIAKMINDVQFCEQCSQNNLDIVKKFDISNTEKIMKEIYENIGVN